MIIYGYLWTMNSLGTRVPYLFGARWVCWSCVVQETNKNKTTVSTVMAKCKDPKFQSEDIYIYIVCHGLLFSKSSGVISKSRFECTSSYFFVPGIRWEFHVVSSRSISSWFPFSGRSRDTRPECFRGPDLGSHSPVLGAENGRRNGQWCGCTTIR